MRRVVNLRPPRLGRILLALLPFVLLILVYLVASDARLAENPNDKLLPSFSKIADAVERLAFEPSRRTGRYEMLGDTLASLQRLLIGISIAAFSGLLIGILSGIVPYARATVSPFLAAVSMVPPMAILPILFIVFGLEEASKVALVVLGTAPLIARDMEMRAGDLPQEQIVKAQTLGASSWLLVLRVVLPQCLPRLIDAVRLSLGPAWLYVIAAEAIASTQGLGYRIFLVRRYLAMDIILPYVVWITLLAFLMDFLLRTLRRRAFPWAESRVDGEAEA